MSSSCGWTLRPIACAPSSDARYASLRTCSRREAYLADEFPQVLFRAWLAANHDTATELWMGLYKKHVPDRGLTWEEGVIEALCWGWIDSARRS